MTPKAIASFALGPVGGALLGFLTLPIVTWFFAAEDIGRLSMLHVTLNFAVLVFSLGLDQAYVREYHESEHSPTLFKLVLLPGFLILTLSLILIAPALLSSWVFGIASSELGLLLGLCIVAAFLSRFFSLILRMQERGLAFSLSQVLPKVIFLGAIGAFVLLDSSRELLQLLVGQTLAIVIVCLINALLTRREWLDGIKTPFKREALLPMLKYGMPLILGGVAFWGLTATDKIFIRALSNYEELGIYSVAVSFAAAATIIQTIFSTVWAPMVYKWVSQGDNLDKVNTVIQYVLTIVLTLFALAGSFAWIVNYILPPKYELVPFLVAACMGYPLLYTLSETTKVGIGVTRKTKLSMVAALIAFAVNCLGNWWLIPLFGAAGAAVSTCFAFWVFFLLRTEFSIMVWRPIPRLGVYLPTLVMVCLAVITALVGIQQPMLSVVGWLLVLLGTVVLRREHFKAMAHWLVKKRKERAAR